MEKILIYTFRTFPFKDDLPYKNFKVFGKINDDIKIFCQEIITTRPDRIMGVAKSTGKYSTIEKYSINQFNQNKKILSDAPEYYELDVPVNLKEYFHVRTKPTKSFCNLSIFKIKRFLDENKLDIPFTFIHVLQKDLKRLPSF